MAHTTVWCIQNYAHSCLRESPRFSVCNGLILTWKSPWQCAQPRVHYQEQAKNKANVILTSTQCRNPELPDETIRQHYPSSPPTPNLMTIIIKQSIYWHTSFKSNCDDKQRNRDQTDSCVQLEITAMCRLSIK